MKLRIQPFAFLSFHPLPLAVIPLLLIPCCGASGQGTAAIAQTTLPKAQGTYHQAAMSFEANTGQADGSVQFLAHGSGYGLYLTGREAVLALHGKPCDAAALRAAKLPVAKPSAAAPCKQDSAVVTLHLDGMATGTAAPVGEDELAGKVNYFVGNDRAKWHTGAATFGKVRYRDVYPGVDLVYYGNQRQLEYDFLVAPGADAQHIRLSFTGGNRVSLRADGGLTVTAGSGKLALQRPLIYQTIDGQRRAIDGSFTLLKGNAIGFRIGSYDHTQPLVIDPVLVYSTYLGGNGVSGSVQYPYNAGNAIATDAAGNLYVAGVTLTPDFPVTAGAFQAQNHATANYGGNAFVTKYDALGNLVFATYLGGSSIRDPNDLVSQFADAANAVAVDATGNVYVAGTTYSTDFPTTAGAFQPNFKPAYNSACNSVAINSLGQTSGFVSKLAPSGASLVYSTYLSGSGQDDEYADSSLANSPPVPVCAYVGDSINALALDAAGDAYVAGYAVSSDFPVTPGVLQPVNRGNVTGFGGNAFVSKLNPAGSGLLYSTYLGGSAVDIAVALQTDSAGDAYVGGQSLSADFPVTQGAFQTTFHESVKSSASQCRVIEAGYCRVEGSPFVAKINPTATALLYATFLGGSTQDVATALAIDATGEAYLAGYTTSTDFPVTAGVFQRSNTAAQQQGASSAFVSKLNPTGTALVYSTFLGGSSTNTAAALAVDALGNAYVGGETGSTDFPAQSTALQPKLNGSACNLDGTDNGFLAELNPTASALVYSTYLGGSGADGFENGPEGINALTLDATNKVYVTGTAYSLDFPLTFNAAQSTPNSAVRGYTAFVSKLDLTATSATPTVTVSPASGTFGANQPVNVVATVKSTVGGPTPTGTIVLESESYIDLTIYKASAPLVNGSAQFTLPAGTLVAGPINNNNCVIANYTPDAASYPLYNPSKGQGVLTVGIQATVGTQPAGLSFSVDGTTYTSTQTFGWNQGDTHTIATTSPQTASGTQATFTSWSDNRAISHTITVPGTSVAYTASFNTNYQLTTSANPSAGGSVTPASGTYYAAGTVVNLQATANPGYIFNGWTGPVANASSVATTVTINAPEAVVANFGTYGVSLTPGSLTFSATSGTMSRTQPAVLLNNGTLPLTIGSIGITGTNASSFSQTNNCVSPLAVGSSCTILVTFSPASATGYSASLTVTDSAGTSPQTVTLTGTGTPPPAPIAALTPGSLSFTATSGTTSGSQAATLSNTGNATLTIAGINLAGTNAANFAVTTGTNACGNTLAANASCFIYITFTPTSVTNFAAMLSVADNSAASPQAIMLTGAGTPPPAPIASLTPGSLTFSSVNGVASASLAATLSNTGNAALTIAGIILTGTNPSNFAVTTGTNACGNTLAANASCFIYITFTPTSITNFAATLSVADNAAGSPQTTALTGTGTPPISFTVSSPSPAQTVVRGATAVFPITVTAVNGAVPGTVSLAVTGLPAGVTASFVPASVAPGSSSATSQFSVQTPVTLASNHGGSPLWPVALPSLALAGFLLIPAKRRRGRTALCLLFCVAGAAVAALSGCGGGVGLAPSNYMLTITATDGSQSQATTVQLTVK